MDGRIASLDVRPLNEDVPTGGDRLAPHLQVLQVTHIHPAHPQPSTLEIELVFSLRSYC